MANLRVDKITSTETFETTGSVQFDGVNGTNLQISNSTDIQLGSGTNWTIEFWALRTGAFVDYDVIIGKGNGSGTYEWFVEGFADGAVDILYSADGTTTWTGQHEILSSMDLNKWYHFALVRNGTSFKAYIDGTETFSKTGFDIYAGTGDLHIGGYGGASAQDPPMFISNVRIVNGVSIYTSNFKPPMRELENIPGTVLLACQSKTDASLEKTGKTITVNGGAFASELTPGILTPVPKAGAGSAITGSVEFDGNGDYLSVDSSVFNPGTGDFTFEWWQKLAATDVSYSAVKINSSVGGDGIRNGNSAIQFYVQGSINVAATATLTTTDWEHVAIVRSSGVISIYQNGVLLSNNLANLNPGNSITASIFEIGNSWTGSNYAGFLSNFRVVVGTAVYVDDFIPPTRELKKVPGTTLLCCQDENSVTTEATGKTITSNGDPAASNFTPQVGDDRKVTFEGVTKINTDAYFYLPTGNTESRDSQGGHRGLFIAGASTNTIEFVTISTGSNASSFGDTSGGTTASAACSSSTRGVSAGGLDTPVQSDTIEYVTIASLGNTIDFGNLTVARRNLGAASNSTRGLFFGGDSPSDSDVIDFITISSTGNALDFGNLSTAVANIYGCASPTRGILGGGESPTILNTIEYVTIASKGDAQDFGDLSVTRSRFTSTGSGTRGVFAAGRDPSNVNTIDYVTIASTGNAKDFGDVTLARQNPAATSDSIRGVIAGGYTSSNTKTIDFIVIPAMNNALDFGDLISARREFGACSNGHGGLG